MEIVTVALLGLAVLVASALFSRRTGVAAPLLLLVLGIIASFVPWVPDIALTPELVLLGVLPPLLYATGRNVPVNDLRRNLTPIFWLSVVMVVIPAVVVGVVVHAVFPEISLPLAIALGAAVAPIDAVAATSIGRRLGLPDRIMILLEGESLFNDAAALVTMRMAVAALTAGFSLSEAALEFVWAVVAGLGIGLLAGWLIGTVRSKLDDPVLVTVVTVASPWVAYVPAEYVHSSGVIAVVVCAVMMAHLAPRQLSVAERSMVTSTWSTVSYVLEHAVFLVMGMQVALLIPLAQADGGLAHVWQLSALVLGLLILLRVIGVAVPVVLSKRHSSRAARIGDALDGEQAEQVKARLRALRRRDGESDSEMWLNRTRADIAYAQSEELTARGGVVLAWAGMRGVVTLAAIQTIPVVSDGHSVEHRAWIVLAAFTVAVASLLLFGGTLPWVIRKAGLTAPDINERRAEEKQLMATLLEDVNAQLGPLDAQQIAGVDIDPEVLARFKRRLAFLNSRTRTAALRLSSDAGYAYWVLYTRYLEALRRALEQEKAVGAYSHHALKHAEQVIDSFEEQAALRY